MLGILDVCLNLALLLMMINVTRRSKIQEQFDSFNRKMLEEIVKDNRVPESLREQIKLGMQLNVAIYLDSFDKTTKKFPGVLSIDSMVINLREWFKAKREKKV